jgi:hypothetical protein
MAKRSGYHFNLRQYAHQDLWQNRRTAMLENHSPQHPKKGQIRVIAKSPDKCVLAIHQEKLTDENTKPEMKNYGNKLSTHSSAH